MGKVLTERIERIEQIAKGIYQIRVLSEHVAKHALPGQFINVKCGEGLNALLRRPISILDADSSKGTFDFAFGVKGVGTELLARKQVGDTIDLVAPLGRPFEIKGPFKKIAVVGGGIGVFPLLFLLKHLDSCEKHTFLGFRNKDFVVLEEAFQTASNKLTISTDDGSYGYNGLILEPLIKSMETEVFDMIFTCGPTPLLRRVAEVANSRNILCQVSLEQRMGCGIGACLVCACKTKSGEGFAYSHVCKDGPVFWASEVIFDEK